MGDGIAEADGRDAVTRVSFDRKTAELVGLRLTGIEYWDLANTGDEPRSWEHPDWHHAVMGVGLATDRGPRLVLWSSTFSSYGLEVYAQPMSEQLRLGPGGPEGWSVTEHPEWRARVGQPVLAADTYWCELSVGPAHRVPDGALAEPARTYEVPVAFRLDLEAGPVWFVAGQPLPDEDHVAWMGDEVMVVFTAARMRALGFPDGGFVAPT